MTATINVEARQRLDQHLDAVEAALAAAGNTREQRRGVMDDLEAQILDMLAARTATPTLGDVEAVLSQLDPPQAYGEAAGARAVVSPPAAPAAVAPAIKRGPRYSQMAIWGLVCIMTSVLPMLILSAIGLNMAVPAVRMEHGTAIAGRTMFPFIACIFVVCGPLGLLGTIFGWVAFGSIRRSNGQLVGMWMALFDGLFWPGAMMLLVLMSVLHPR